MVIKKYSSHLSNRQSHLSQKVVLAHHVPVPDLHRHASTLIIITFIQTQLQRLVPVREACLLYDLMKQPGIITLTAEHAHEEFILIPHTDHDARTLFNSILLSVFILIVIFLILFHIYLAILTRRRKSRKYIKSEVLIL